MPNLTWLASPFTTLAASMPALIGLAILVVGLRGKLVPRRARCAACLHELHDPMPPHCAECGADLARRDAIDWGRHVVRGAACAIGTTVIVVGIVVLAIAGVAGSLVANQAIAGSPVLTLGPDALRARIVDLPADDALWATLTMAVERQEFDAARVEALLEAASTRMIEALRRQEHLAAMSAMSLVAAILHVGGLPDERLSAILPALAADLEIASPTLVHDGEPIFVIPESTLTRNEAFLPDLTLALGVRSVTVGGEPLEQTTMAAFPRSPANAAPRPGATIVPAYALPGGDAAPVHARGGVIELEIGPVLTIAVTPMRLLRAVPTAAGPPPMPPPFDVALPTVRHRVEIVHGTEVFPRPIRDEELAARAREAIRIERVMLLPDLGDPTGDGRDTVAFVGLRIESIATVGLAYEATLRIDPDGGATDGIEIPLGAVDVEAREFQSLRLYGVRGRPAMWRTISLGGWSAPIPAGVDRATLVLTPRPSAFLQLGGTDRRLDVPLVFADLPIERFDLAPGTGGTIR